MASGLSSRTDDKQQRRRRHITFGLHMLFVSSLLRIETVFARKGTSPDDQKNSPAYCDLESYILCIAKCEWKGRRNGNLALVSHSQSCNYNERYSEVNCSSGWLTALSIWQHVFGHTKQTPPPPPPPPVPMGSQRNMFCGCLWASDSLRRAAARRWLLWRFRVIRADPFTWFECREIFVLGKKQNIRKQNLFFILGLLRLVMKNV